MRADNSLIAVAGATRSGKTTFIREVERRYAASTASFGHLVRERTEKLGLPQTRHSWQQVGEEWIATDRWGLCEQVLGRLPAVGIGIIDGVRHVTILEILKEISHPRPVILLFVECTNRVRQQRLLEDGLHSSGIARILAHSTDEDVPALRARADLVINGEIEPPVNLDLLTSRIESKTK